MLYVDTLCQLILHLIRHPYQGLLLPSDGTPRSTTELIRAIRVALGRRPDLITMPDIFWWMVKNIRYDFYIRLMGSFEVDSEGTFQKLGFWPDVEFEQAIRDSI